MSGTLFGLVAGYSLLAVANLRHPSPSAAALRDAEADPPRASGGDAALDPAMVANANLTESLHECSRQLTSVLDDNAHLELQVEAAHNVDAGASAQERRIARRNLTQKDWKDLARAGTVKYLLPCASFNPAPETMDRLGLAPRDVAVVHDAFAAARDTAWGWIRPLCVTAVGGSAQADRLGLDSCPEVVLASAKGVSAADTDRAMRAVAAVRAGLADPKTTIPSGDPIGTALLALTGVAQDAEARIGSQLGPDDARVIVYGSNNCSHMVELAGTGSESAL